MHCVFLRKIISIFSSSVYVLNLHVVLYQNVEIIGLHSFLSCALVDWSGDFGLAALSTPFKLYGAFRVMIYCEELYFNKFKF